MFSRTKNQLLVNSKSIRTGIHVYRVTRLSQYFSNRRVNFCPWWSNNNWREINRVKRPGVPQEYRIARKYHSLFCRQERK